MLRGKTAVVVVVILLPLALLCVVEYVANFYALQRSGQITGKDLLLLGAYLVLAFVSVAGTVHVILVNRQHRKK